MSKGYTLSLVLGTTDKTAQHLLCESERAPSATWEVRWRTCEHDVEHDAAGPDVCRLAVVVVIQQHLRSGPTVLRCHHPSSHQTSMLAWRDTSGAM